MRIRFVPVVAMVFLGQAVACSKPATEDPAARLEADAIELSRFLSGKGRFDAFELADTVELRVAADGGGGVARIPREQLRDPAAWQLESGGRTRTFVPTGLRTRVVAEVGRYMNCKPSDIGTRYPALAASPHVGVRLEPPRVRSCMETWNATFVFDTTGGGRPRLTTAIYDQWEW